MPITLFHAGTVVLFVAAMLMWQVAEWAFLQCWGAGAALAFWLTLSGAATVVAGLLFVAFICNVIDTLAPLWREPKPKT